jgi:5-methylcytosine-specific restriction endonuclease McrA
MQPDSTKRPKIPSRRQRMAWMDTQAMLQENVLPSSADRAEVKRRLMALVEDAIDEKLASLKEGQALGIVFKLDVVNSDGSLREGPSARNSVEYSEWRQQVYERDEFRCRRCDSKERLQAHHVKSWHDYPELRFEVGNGLTLCADCHAREHPHLKMVAKGRTRDGEKQGGQTDETDAGVGG